MPCGDVKIEVKYATDITYYQYTWVCRTGLEYMGNDSDLHNYKLGKQS